MQFKIQQIALAPKDPRRAAALLARIGIAKWVEDRVVATGTVHGEPGQNVAALAFNYEAIEGKELELLKYLEGPSWLEGRGPIVSHLGMHCTEEELAQWKALFAEEGIVIAQEVFTDSHTNDFLVKCGRKYHYCIFDTLEILGVDLKFIVRIERSA